jgi:TatD DNase family protein
MLELADSHGHLTMVFDGGTTAGKPRAPSREEAGGLVARAREAGVTRILVPATSRDDARLAVEIAEAHEGVFAAVGIHPHEAKWFDEDADLELFEKLCTSKKVVAVGEIGLDFHYGFSPRDVQKKALVAQLRFARERGLPVLLHNRESEGTLLPILEAEYPGGPGAFRGVLHSFAADAETGRKAIALGYLVSFSGMLTFRAADNVRAAADALPLSAMLLETDAPYLAPVPHRGRPNEPAYLPKTASVLARLKGTTPERSPPPTVAPAPLRHGMKRRAGRPPRLSMAEFEKLVEQALEELPREFRDRLENVVIAVEEESTDEDYDLTDTPDDEELSGSPRPDADRDDFGDPGLLPRSPLRGPILRNTETSREP